MQAALSSALLSEASLLHSCTPKRNLKQFTTMAIGYGYSNRSDRYRHKPSLNLTLKQLTTMEKRELWKIVIQTLITILTAIGTSLGVVSCM